MTVQHIASLPTRADVIDAAGLVLFLIVAWHLTDFAGAMLS